MSTCFRTTSDFFQSFENLKDRAFFNDEIKHVELKSSACAPEANYDFLDSYVAVTAAISASQVFTLMPYVALFKTRRVN